MGRPLPESLETTRWLNVQNLQACHGQLLKRRHIYMEVF